MTRWIGALVLVLVAAGGCGPQVEASDYGRPHMRWWREARFGMFVHYNVFSQWDTFPQPHQANKDFRAGKITREQFYQRSVAKLSADPGFAEQWAAAAKAGGMKYIVLTTRHACGFSLWDSKLNRYNSVNYGPKRDLVAEFVKACRSHGLKVGFYFSLYDGYHPDSTGLAAKDSAARKRFLAYTRGLLRELMTQYGTVDILWYDQAMMMGYAGEWESTKMNAMVRRLQPNICINDRSMVAEDFSCPERGIHWTLYPDRDWEACMTFNQHWGWKPTPEQEYLTARQIIGMLAKCTGNGGNLLLNVGPRPDGATIGDVEVERLAEVGRWLKAHGEAVYGRPDRVEQIGNVKTNVKAAWSRRGNAAYLWLPQWPKEDIIIDAVRTKLLRCSIVGRETELPFEQDAKNLRITIRGLPDKCPDDVCGYAVLKLQFADYPR